MENKEKKLTKEQAAELMDILAADNLAVLRRVYIEKFEFNIGGFFDGFKHVKIWTEGDKMYKSYKGDFHDPLKEYTKEMTWEEIESIQVGFERCRITKWLKRYEPIEPVMDGTYWNIDIKESGKRIKHISGDNAYPKRWNEFIYYLSNVIPEFANEIVEKE